MIAIYREPKWIAALKDLAGPKEMDVYEDLGIPLDEGGVITFKGFARRVLRQNAERIAKDLMS